MSKQIEILGVKVGLRPRTKRAGWECRFSWNGKQRTCSGLSEAEAIKRTTEYLQAAQGEAEKLANVALLDDLGYWLAANLGPLFSQRENENTRVKNMWALGRVAGPCNGLKISQLSAADVSVAWSRIRRENPNPNTQRTLYAVLRMGLDRLTRARRIGWNFMEDIPRPVAPARTNLITAAEGFALWHRLHIEGDYHAPKVFLCLVLGLREEEASEARIEDLTEESLFVRGTKTANAERTIHLSTRISRVLAGYASTSRRWICETPDGKPLPTGSTVAINRRYRLHGLKVTGWHCLRHAFGEIESGAGAAPSIRMAILGQSTKSIQGLYVHPTPANMRESLEKWEGYLEASVTERLPAELGTAWVQGFERRAEKAAK